MLHFKLSVKSLLKIRKKRGPKIEACGTPAEILHHVDALPFKTNIFIGMLLDDALFKFFLLPVV